MKRGKTTKYARVPPPGVLSLKKIAKSLATDRARKRKKKGAPGGLLNWFTSKKGMKIS